MYNVQSKFSVEKINVIKKITEVKKLRNTYLNNSQSQIYADVQDVALSKPLSIHLMCI